MIYRTTGLTCEFAPGVFSDENCSSVILQVMQMDAKLWLDWIAKIMNATYALDRPAGKVYFAPTPAPAK